MNQTDKLSKEEKEAWFTNNPSFNPNEILPNGDILTKGDIFNANNNIMIGRVYDTYKFRDSEINRFTYVYRISDHTSNGVDTPEEMIAILSNMETPNERTNEY